MKDNNDRRERMFINIFFLNQEQEKNISDDVGGRILGFVYLYLVFR